MKQSHTHYERLVTMSSPDVQPTEYRDKAIDEYGDGCLHCGIGYKANYIEVHHIDGDRTNNDLENLTVLCKKCHGNAHSSNDQPPYLPEKGFTPNHSVRSVTAEVTKEVQRALNMEAAKYELPVYQIAGEELTDWYEQSEYSPENDE